MAKNNKQSINEVFSKEQRKVIFERYSDFGKVDSKKEDGKLVKKAFLPEYDSFLSTDYSQIELRVLAHLSGSQKEFAQTQPP